MRYSYRIFYKFKYFKYISYERKILKTNNLSKFQHWENTYEGKRGEKVKNDKKLTYNINDKEKLWVKIN